MTVLDRLSSARGERGEASNKVVAAEALSRPELLHEVATGLGHSDRRLIRPSSPHRPAPEPLGPRFAREGPPAVLDPFAPRSAGARLSAVLDPFAPRSAGARLSAVLDPLFGGKMVVHAVPAHSLRFPFHGRYAPLRRDRQQ